MSTLNERIKKVRKALDLTQQEFADRLRIKRNTVATYETGKSNPSDAAVVLICKTFNVNETWLRTGEGEMFVPKPVDTLDELVQKLGLSDGDRILIQKFLDLNAAERQAVLNYVLSVADEYSDKAAQSAPAPATKMPQEMTDAELHTELDRQIAAEREKAEGMSASGRGGSGTVAG